MNRLGYVMKLSGMLPLCALLVSSDACLGQTIESLEQRVTRGDTEAFLQAGKEGREDLIPALEKSANSSTDPLDGGRIMARMALAKLGVKRYLDDFIADWTTTNSPMFNFNRENYRGLGTPRAEREAELATKFLTMHRLVYIGDKSTVKYVAADLYNTNTPTRHPSSTDLLESRTPIAAIAARALSEMNLENAPQPGAESDPEGLSRIEVWKKWWEQNKSKYP